jgi:hypothetical protein
LLYRDAREAIVVDADGLASVYAEGGRAGLLAAVRARIAQPDDPDAVYALEFDGRASPATRRCVPRPRARLERRRERTTARACCPHARARPRRRLATGLRLRSESGFLDADGAHDAGRARDRGVLGIAIGALTARWVARRLQHSTPPPRAWRRRNHLRAPSTAPATPSTASRCASTPCWTASKRCWPACAKPPTTSRTTCARR